jgi:His/Glu/Gln/Arg/opine family amino acid ABC transporter permease subunit
MRTRIWRRGLAVAAALMLGAGAAAAQSALARVRGSGQLRIGTDATYPPFASAEGGSFSGFDIDLGRALARTMGVEPVFVNASFDGIFPALQNGTFDIVISAVTITAERQAAMLFSDPYIDAGQLLAVRRDRPGINGPADLSGKRVGVQINTTAQFDLEKRAGVEVVKYNTIDLALLDLQNGRVDAVVSDAPVLRYMARLSFPDLTTVGEQFTDEKLGIVLARGSEDLRRAVNAALWRIEESGESARLHRQWFGEASAAPGEPSAGARRSTLFDAGLVGQTWRFLVRGVWMTAALAGIALLLGLPIGLGLALARVQPARALSVPATVYVEVVRGTPLLVQILFIYFVLPAFGVNLPAFTSGIIALTLNSAAYLAEIFRAGIESIEAGQMEAARSLGMSYAQAMRRVILPQTFRRVVPPMTNEGIALLKDSSLVSVIGLTELARTGQELASRHAAPLTIWPMVALMYLLLTFPLTRVAQQLERRWRPAARG